MAEKVRELLEEQARRHGVGLSEKQIDQFVAYLKLIQRWQRRAVRLVGSAEPAELVGKHVSDAFAVYNCVAPWRGRKVIDIGSGAGFPGLCLKLIEPSLDITLLEASSRKAAFLAKVRNDLSLDGVDIIRGRAEDLGRAEGFQEEFDLATVRGVASLGRAIEIGMPFVRVGGSLVLIRGMSSRKDVEGAVRIGARLGAGDVLVYSGSEEDSRMRGSVMVLLKVAGTDEGSFGGSVNTRGA